ncbi:hypothetical protein KAR91_22510 [Candidatus Pacearchaeota archaeon]|nr:hypothetical protein [Candidatus Pacearchaeota archaeon]
MNYLLWYIGTVTFFWGLQYVFIKLGLKGFLAEEIKEDKFLTEYYGKRRKKTHD